ncbi:DUF1007 family protein [Halomonas sp. ML-15]|uniref:DUF1007 family protein n=1 Tax=Halomonas sp. ML-15 TaxID=2773305 RepID=UPI001746DE80|nr:DUF1007 family protein [Halomonas sp. ML-15]MBD3895532.1 DUF1007 family protein [Halomonas sp. ML-15]
MIATVGYSWWRRLALGVALTLLPCLVWAHPHGWIDMSMRVILDDDGRVEALHQRWRMDPFYSLVLLEELGRAQGEESLEERLDLLGMEIRDTLAPQGYFTELRHADNAVALGDVQEYTVMERDGRVEFVFLLPLEAPLALDGEPLAYRVYDPTYYIEVLHEENGDGPSDEALVMAGADTRCSTRIIPADPDPARVAQAARLDITDEAPDGLGRYFAETGEIQCDG